MDLDEFWWWFRSCMTNICMNSHINGIVLNHSEALTFRQNLKFRESFNFFYNTRRKEFSFSLISSGCCRYWRIIAIFSRDVDAAIFRHWNLSTSLHTLINGAAYLHIAFNHSLICWQWHFVVKPKVCRIHHLLYSMHSI